jgi:hypothetical protein
MDSVEKRSNMDEYARLLDRPLNTWPDTEAGRPKKEQQQSFLGRIFPTSASSALTVVAHGTTPFITTFLLIHLSAPVAAIGGGSSLASQVMVRSLRTICRVIEPSLMDVMTATGQRVLPNTSRREVLGYSAHIRPHRRIRRQTSLGCNSLSHSIGFSQP